MDQKKAKGEKKNLAKIVSEAVVIINDDDRILPPVVQNRRPGVRFGNRHRRLESKPIFLLKHNGSATQLYTQNI